MKIKKIYDFCCIRNFSEQTSWSRRLKQLIIKWQIRMEIIIMLISISDTARLIVFIAKFLLFRIVVTPTLMLEKVHRAYSVPENATSTDKFYNKKIVLWDQNYTAVNVPLACFVTVIFGLFFRS